MLRILRNARVFAPEPLGIRDLIVGGGKILWLGRGAPDVARQLVAQERDLEGARVIPGLVDCHVHLTGGGGESGPDSQVPPLALSSFTRGGTTSVVGVLGTDDLTRSTASLLAATRSLVAQGIDAWCLTGGYHLPPMTLTGGLRSDIVHIDRIIGVGELALSDHRSSQPTLDELLRVASETHVAGLMTGKAGILHLHMGDGERGLSMVRQALASAEIPPRVFHPTHVNRRRGLFDEATALVSSGCSIDVTAFPVEEGEDAWSAADALERYLDAGLAPNRITVSSDAGGSLPSFDEGGRVERLDVGRPAALVETLQALLDRDRPLEEILPAFTSNVASLWRLAGKGRLSRGADADLAVLDDEGAIMDVLAGGEWHVEHGRVCIRGPFE